MYGDLCLWLRRRSREVLKILGLRLNKELAQHLMVSCKLGLDFLSVIKQLGIKRIFEFGLGTGFLTKFISVPARYVVGIELDKRLAVIAQKLLQDQHNVMIIIGDGTKFLEGSCIRAEALVSNPPFSISTLLIIGFIKSNYSTSLMTLQKELAERLIAKPGSRNYSRLTVLSSLLLNVRIIRTYPPSAFYPAPEVSISLVLMKKKGRYIPYLDYFEDFLAGIFSQKRRKIIKAILHYLEIRGYKICRRDIEEIVSKYCNPDSKVMHIQPEDILRIFLDIINLRRR